MPRLNVLLTAATLRMAAATPCTPTGTCTDDKGDTWELGPIAAEQIVAAAVPDATYTYKCVPCRCQKPNRKRFTYRPPQTPPMPHAISNAADGDSQLHSCHLTDKSLPGRRRYAFSIYKNLDPVSLAPSYTCDFPSAEEREGETEGEREREKRERERKEEEEEEERETN